MVSFWEVVMGERDADTEAAIKDVYEDLTKDLANCRTSATAITTSFGAWEAVMGELKLCCDATDETARGDAEEAVLKKRLSEIKLTQLREKLNSAIDSLQKAEGNLDMAQKQLLEQMENMPSK
jgi:hypothetical protein